jgi:hypothetical protein
METGEISRWKWNCLCALKNPTIIVSLTNTFQNELKTDEGDVKVLFLKNMYLVSILAVPQLRWLSLASPCGSPG